MLRGRLGVGVAVAAWAAIVGAIAIAIGAGYWIGSLLPPAAGGMTMVEWTNLDAMIEDLSKHYAMRMALGIDPESALIATAAYLTMRRVDIEALALTTGLVQMLVKEARPTVN